MSRKSRLTLEEIGKIAGVSRATVSRVVNNHPNIRPEVREHVQKVIDEMGYQPNLAARSLASNKSNILGLFIPGVGGNTLFIDPYYPKLIQGISRACNAADYILSLFLFESDQEAQINFAPILGSGLMDGLIITASTNPDPYIPQIKAKGTPFVMIGRPGDAKSVNYADADNQYGGYLATQHLIQGGFQKIATIACPQVTSVGQDRFNGYLGALKVAGRPVNDKLITEADFTVEGGYHAMQRLLPHHPDAVFVATDSMAVGALQAIQDAGLSVPDDIALVGFDDFPPAVNANPKITTIRQPVQETGSAAVNILLDILESESEVKPRQQILPVELIVRQSSGTQPSSEAEQ